MKFSFFFLIILGTFSRSRAEEGYAVSNIPVELLKNAHVVKRMELLRFEITEGSKARYYKKMAYTILDEQGDAWADAVNGYDRLVSIENFEGTLYDAAGKKLKNLKKSEVRDISGSGQDDFVNDYRLKWHNFYYKVYPYTVEYEVEFYYKATMFLPDWIPQEQWIMSVQQSKLIVSCPVSNPLRYKTFNYDGMPVITEDKSNRIYSWEAKNIQGRVIEYATPAWHELTTSVFLATDKFSLENYEGSNASWKDFGRFVYDLKKDRDILSDDTKKKVHELTDGLHEPSEKINRLYEYLQQNTRYISIQLGVGGWQPFDARYVGSKKYGDCKALSNFMYSLLKEAGIRSVYTVIHSGLDEDFILPDLPSSQFNHVILFVPLGKDTTWLECTSPTRSPGYLGNSTDNRWALAVDENGGTLVRTPAYGMHDNLEIRNIHAAIDENGNAVAQIHTRYMALQQDEVHGIINGLSKDKLMEYLKENIELTTYDIQHFEYKEKKGPLPEIEEKLNLTIDQYATVTGKRFFIIPNLITRMNRRLKTGDKRESAIVLRTGFTDIDTAEITIPPGYAPESVPPAVSIESKFGLYSASVLVTAGKIIYYRKLEHISGRFPPSDYEALVKFYDAIYKADRNKVVLVKNQ